MAKRVLEDFGTAEFHDPVREPLHIDSRCFFHDLKNVFFRSRIVVNPSATAEAPGAVVPSSKNELRRWWLVCIEGWSKTKPAAKTIALGIDHRSGQHDQ